MLSEKGWLLLLTVIQLLAGVILLLQIGYTWCKMRKLKTLISFMRKLLLMISLKTLALLGESIYILVCSDWFYGNDSTVYITACTEFINWIITQVIIWFVAMRFYESSIPIKRLELSIKRQ